MLYTALDQEAVHKGDMWSSVSNGREGPREGMLIRIEASVVEPTAMLSSSLG